MHLLIPYIQTSEKGPDFDEFTYGDVHARGKKLLTKVKKGDYIFLHSSLMPTSRSFGNGYEFRSNCNWAFLKCSP